MLNIFCLFSIICNIILVSATNDGTFYYYAYGSNLLAKRIHINNPSATFFSTAKLEVTEKSTIPVTPDVRHFRKHVFFWLVDVEEMNYRLDFNMYVESWNGAVATIVEDDDASVWGALWKLNVSHINFLDEQEGVRLGWYYAKNVTVITPDNKQIVARTYQETINPNKTSIREDLPLERRPSNTYLAVIVLGAIESHLPADYIGFLFSLPTNGEMASKKIRKKLGYPF